MRSAIAALALIAPCTLAASSSAQIFLSPRPPTSSIKCSARDANALLSSHLGIAEYEAAPTGKTGFWDALGLPAQRSPWEAPSNSLIIMVEGAGDSSDYLPYSLTSQGETLSIPSPPSPTAFDALVSVYLRRIARTFSLHLGEIHGVEAFAHSAASVVEGWADWAVDGLHDSWTYFEEMMHLRPEVTTPVEPKPEYNRLISEFNLVDQSAKVYLQELGDLDRFVESLTVNRHSLDADSSIHHRPRIAALRFSGLQAIERAHGRSSSQYKKASQMFRSVLEAAISAFNGASLNDAKVVALVVPPRAQHRAILKRSATDLLSPFYTHGRVVKRQHDDGDKKQSKPLVPISQKCYSDADTCKNQTDSCSGHGSCTEATVLGGGKGDESCFVCQCKPTKGDNGETIWTGDRCQKQDYSTQFFLLVGTVVGLIALVWVSIIVLWGIDADPMPPTLAAINGMGKRD